MSALASSLKKPVCNGTKTYTFTYTDCSGATATWDYVYTISAPVFSVPTAGSSTVACPADANVTPTAPTVTDNCGRTVTPTLTSQTTTPVCNGTKTYTFTYTDCSGATATWDYVYTISAPVFSVPTAGSSTVACPADANVTPTAPTVTDNCGRTVTPTLTSQTTTPVCNGTKTYTFTYTDCSGATATWDYVYTISAPVFSVPTAGSSTVACPADANVTPTAPTVTDNCGRTVTPTLTSQTTTPVCNGTKTYTFTYTDCSGATATWDYVYTISAPVFSVPTAGSSTVACPADANVTPTAPTVTDNCGRTVTPTLTSQTTTPVCNGTKTYTFTYTDCSGATATWDYVYTISAPVFSVPTAGSSTVACPADANVTPTAPTVTDNCGRTVTPTLTSQTTTPVCNGTKTYTFTYTD